MVGLSSRPAIWAVHPSCSMLSQHPAVQEARDSPAAKEAPTATGRCSWAIPPTGTATLRCIDRPPLAARHATATAVLPRQVQACKRAGVQACRRAGVQGAGCRMQGCRDAGMQGCRVAAAELVATEPCRIADCRPGGKHLQHRPHPVAPGHLEWRGPATVAIALCDRPPHRLASATSRAAAAHRASAEPKAHRDCGHAGVAAAPGSEAMQQLAGDETRGAAGGAQ